MTRTSTELEANKTVSQFHIEKSAGEAEEKNSLHVGVRHPALKDILEAGHAVQCFADVQHKEKSGAGKAASLKGKDGQFEVQEREKREERYLEDRAACAAVGRDGAVSSASARCVRGRPLERGLRLKKALSQQAHPRSPNEWSIRISSLHRNRRHLLDAFFLSGSSWLVRHR